MPFISYILRYIAKEIVRYAFKGFIRNIGGRGIYKLFKDLFGGKSIKDIFKQYVRTWITTNIPTANLWLIPKDAKYSAEKSFKRFLKAFAKNKLIPIPLRKAWYFIYNVKKGFIVDNFFDKITKNKKLTPNDRKMIKDLKKTMNDNIDDKELRENTRDEYWNYVNQTIQNLNYTELGAFLQVLTILHKNEKILRDKIAEFDFDLTDTQDMNFQWGYKAHMYIPKKQRMTLTIRGGWFTNNQEILDKHIIPYHNDEAKTYPSPYHYFNISMNQMSNYLLSSAFGKECFERDFKVNN